MSPKKNKHYVLIDTMIGLFTSSFCRVVKKSVLVIARNIVLGGSKKEQYILYTRTLSGCFVCVWCKLVNCCDFLSHAVQRSSTSVTIECTNYKLLWRRVQLRREEGKSGPKYGIKKFGLLNNSQRTARKPASEQRNVNCFLCTNLGTTTSCDILSQKHTKIILRLFPDPGKPGFLFYTIMLFVCRRYY